MNPFFILPILLFAFATGTHSYGADEQRLDIGGIKTVMISGDESAIHLTTSATQPYQATLGGTRQGWFSGWSSSWFGDYCPVGGTMRIDNDVLHVATKNAQWFGFSNCTTHVDVNVGAGATISVDQNASQIRLDGHFGAISYHGNAADFSLDGHAQTVNLNANAMRSSLIYDNVDKTEEVDIHANSLDATVDFGGKTALDYQVDAKASLVDAKSPSLPGVHPKVRISAQMVRATIR
jgi:hypothetical protein